MKTWSQSQNVPAAAITFAGSDTNIYPIILTTQHSQSVQESSSNLEWAIRSLEVSISRDWGVSTAMIVLACSVKSSNTELPLLPDVQPFRSGNYPNLTVEDEIRIYAGYVDKPTTPITADMLDEHPISYTGLNNEEVTSDPNKPLAPIFWGFIDKVDFSGSDSALQIILSCRDRTRVLADTIIIYKSSESDSSDNEEVSISNLIKGGDRISLCKSVINSINGFSPTGKDLDSSSCWRPIKEGMEFRGYTTLENGDYQRVTPPEDPAAWVREATLKLVGDKGHPRMHLWLERPPIKKGFDSSNFQIINQTPYNILDYLAKSDERPLDLFASHVNGDYVIGPRTLDTSGFLDEARNFRTYFFRLSPPGDKPSASQMILSIRAVTTTLGTYNNFLVSDSGSKGSAGSFASSIKSAFFTTPNILKNRRISPPCRNFVIYDPSISQAGGARDREAAAIVTGLAYSQIGSRDVNGVQIEILGDPTFYPSEAIRVYNSLVHDRNITFTFDPILREQIYFNLRERAEEAAATDSGQSIEQAINRDTPNEASRLADQLQINPSRTNTNIEEKILPVYKVRNVKHKISAQGKRAFTTIIAAVSDY